LNQKLFSLLAERIELEEIREKEIISSVKGIGWGCVFFSSLFFFLFVLVIRLYQEREEISKIWIGSVVFVFIFSFLILLFIFIFSCVRFGHSRKRWVYNLPEWKEKMRQIDQEILTELKKQPETNQEKNQVKEEKDKQSISDESAS
jgi:predicted PurR-regulated permease PerM